MSFHQQILNKIIPSEGIERYVNLQHFASKRIVFTNGCFDVLHKGHVEYLAKARDLGDLLIVGLNTDASVKRLGKSPERPINTESTRAFVLAGLAVVSSVCIFDEDTPLELIKCVRPAILVKGGDYEAKNIVGYKEVTEAGGQVVTIDLTHGFSTTGLIAQLKKEG
jgi:D-glycero-beta-D-manno-heptose 1-phosphate adenylyltransferase